MLETLPQKREEKVIIQLYHSSSQSCVVTTRRTMSPSNLLFLLTRLLYVPSIKEVQEYICLQGSETLLVR